MQVVKGGLSVMLGAFLRNLAGEVALLAHALFFLAAWLLARLLSAKRVDPSVRRHGGRRSASTSRPPAVLMKAADGVRHSYLKIRVGHEYRT